MSKFQMDDYIEVKDRIALFYEQYPDGRIVTYPPLWHEVKGYMRVQVRAEVYRTPDDPMPCTGYADEIVPGSTPYTANSELENAETSAVGRALANAGIAAHRGVASAEEVRNRVAESTQKRATPAKAAKVATVAAVKSQVLEIVGNKADAAEVWAMVCDEHHWSPGQDKTVPPEIAAAFISAAEDWARRSEPFSTDDEAAAAIQATFPEKS